MRIAISNLAWDVSEDDEISALLLKHNINAIDIVPGKYFRDPCKATDKNIARVKAYWEAKGIEISGMQSLLFGKHKLNIFGNKECQNAMLQHLEMVARLASGLGAKRLVFGSPKNRDRKGLSDLQALTIAKEFFTKLGNIALKHEVVFCLEPNPTVYGANFMTTSEETFNVVSAIKHPAIKMQLDTGAITINQESISEVLEYSRDQIGHIHVSEPGLVVVGDIDTDHQNYARHINTKLNKQFVSIEMLVRKHEDRLASIERALEFVNNTYRFS